MILSRLKAVFIIIEFIITVSIVLVCMYLFRDKTYFFRYHWAKLQLKLLGVTVEEVGILEKDVDMYMINHQSILDIIILEALSKRDLAWVAKKEIHDIPWFGRILSAPRMIIVERESKASLVKLLADVKDRTQAGRPIAIFPEGTRTNGKKLRKFKAGAKIIAQKNKMRVQPIVMIGTREVFDSQNFAQKSGKVKVIYLPSIQADKKTQWYEETEELMRETLQKELNNEL